MEKITNALFELQDLKYADFHGRLMPQIDKNRIIGVRTPILREYAKRLSRENYVMDFLEELPHTYYEENNLHGELIAILFKDDIDKIFEYLEKFLPYVDNWATCDLMSFRIYKKYPEKVYEKVKQWIKSEEVFTKRYGIVTLMSLLDDGLFKEEMLRMVTDIKSSEYYINMARAWYVSIALVKQYDIAIKYLINPVMDEWTHNRSVQKAVESRRISDEKKEYLKTLKIKKRG